MPLDVTMPQLGMAQETGKIVAWHKAAGDPVATGDVLFEVETDKATMEVEAQGDGYLSGVTASEGDEVPVGDVIARITETAETEVEVPAQGRDAATPDLPEGQQVIMPTLGMAQDRGVLVAWLVEPGAKVGADDPLFEVETDKSTVEVPAGTGGYLAAQLAQAGDDVPTGQVIAILTPEAPSETISRSAAQAAKAPEAPAPKAEDPKPKAEAPKPAPEPAPRATGGRILASPKARKLALDQGLDLERLVAAGVPQPFHAKDIETLKSLPTDTAPAQAPVAHSLHLTAEVQTEGLTTFANWAAGIGLSDANALLAGLTGPTRTVAVESFGQRRSYSVPTDALSEVTETEDAPDLLIRDLRASRITAISLGAEATPVLSLTAKGDTLTLTLEAAAGQMTPDDALSLITNVAGRIEDPLRALL